MDWHIDYLTITVWGNDVINFFDLVFVNTFRKLINQGHGGRFYLETFKTDLGVTVRTNPVNTIENRSTIEIPGKACQLIGFIGLSSLLDQLNTKYEKVRVNRIDLAFDNCNFTVKDVEDCLLDDNLRSYFKRSTIKIYNNPYEINEVGEIGTSGITVGGRSSTRYMRIYDKHGFTRLELEFKHDKAVQVALDLFNNNTPEDALSMALGHVRDYIDFFTDWWEVFIQDFERLYKTLPENVKEMNLQNIKLWFENQIASAFFVLASLEPNELNNIYEIGRNKYTKSKYQGLLELEVLK